MSYLIYVNELGPNYKGDNIYEFIFSDSLDEVWGTDWDARPSNGYPGPPDIEYVSKVGTLKKNEVSFSVIQNSDYFCIEDAIQDVICLAWENESDEYDFTKCKRLTFRFGEEETSIKDKLYERDMVLEFEKNVFYEK